MFLTNALAAFGAKTREHTKNRGRARLFDNYIVGIVPACY